MIKLDFIKCVCARSIKEDFIKNLIVAINKWFPKYEINNKLRCCAFLSHGAHETGGFQFLKEIGGDKYFEKYEPGTKIGDALGNKKIGDGLKYKGRGLLQITGRSNYKKYGDLIGLDLIESPDLLLNIDNAVHVSCEFWKQKKLNDLADRGDMVGMTKKINGGLNGLADRDANYLTLIKNWNINNT